MHDVRKSFGRPVVMLHGGILSALDYASMLDLVESLGYRGIAFDRPGHVYSDRPRTKLDPIAQADCSTAPPNSRAWKNRSWWVTLGVACLYSHTLWSIQKNCPGSSCSLLQFDGHEDDRVQKHGLLFVPLIV